MSDILNSENGAEEAFEKTLIDEEEFFERELFQDVLELKSLKKVAENAAIDVNKLQDQAYQTLFNLYQQTRGINVSNSGQDDIFPIFELFFKSYYQYFRQAMEGLLATESPVKIAYFLGKSSDKVAAMFDQFIKEIQNEVD